MEQKNRPKKSVKKSGGSSFYQGEKSEKTLRHVLT